MRVLPSLPIVPQISPAIGAAERRRIAGIARRLLADEPRLPATSFFGDEVGPGLGPWPAFFLEDHGGITLADSKAVARAYGYRILLLAGDGDLVAIGTERSPGFEGYCRETLGLGRPEVRSPAPPAGTLTERCSRDESLLADLATRARGAGGLNLVPYMTDGATWMLAGEIAVRAALPVRVAGPPPHLTRRVNDKLWFAARVAEMFGRGALPDAYAAFSLAALAGRLAALARRSAAVAVKLPASASSLGNIVFEPEEVLCRSAGAFGAELRRLLAGTGWHGDFPVQVTAWESPILASPSVQLWIPDRDRGDPVVEGIFQQVTRGPTRIFSGAQPAALSAVWRSRIANEAARIGLLFQSLGYFGRCSFDAVLVGEGERDALLHWVECNGRWGGTSLPLTLANRLVGNWRRRPFVIIERGNLAMPPRRVEDLLSALEGELYLPGKRAEGAVLLSPGQIETGSGYEMMVLAKTPAAAGRRAEALERRLTQPAAG